MNVKPWDGLSASAITGQYIGKFRLGLRSRQRRRGGIVTCHGEGDGGGGHEARAGALDDVEFEAVSR